MAGIISLFNYKLLVTFHPLLHPIKVVQRHEYTTNDYLSSYLV